MDKLTNYALSFPMISLTSPIHCQIGSKEMQIGTYIILMVQTHEKYLLFYFINIIKTKTLKSSNNSIYER